MDLLGMSMLDVSAQVIDVLARDRGYELLSLRPGKLESWLIGDLSQKFKPKELKYE